MALSIAIDHQRVPGLPEPHEPFDGVERIAVLRGGGLGDLVFALPAIAALRAAYPDAEVTLLGSPSHRALLSGRGLVDDVVDLPAVPGVGNPAAEPADDETVERFFAGQRARGYDLAVQVHGGGRNSNPFLLRLGARHTVGTRTPDAVDLERSMPYVYYQHEVLRALEVVALAGAVAASGGPLLSPSDDERAAALSLLPASSDGSPLVVVHPGASDPRRRWPASKFAETVAALAADGCRVAVVGGEEDRADAERIVEQARERVAGSRAVDREGIVSLAGRVDLPVLLAVLEAADVVIGNDSGPRHLAEAVGARTSSVFWYGNVINAAPLGRTSHRVAIAHRTTCPVCGIDISQVGWTAERCEHDDSVVVDVAVDEVLANTRELLGEHGAVGLG